MTDVLVCVTLIAVLLPSVTQHKNQPSLVKMCGIYSLFKTICRPNDFWMASCLGHFYSTVVLLSSSTHYLGLH